MEITQLPMCFLLVFKALVNSTPSEKTRWDHSRTWTESTQVQPQEAGGKKLANINCAHQYWGLGICVVFASPVPSIKIKSLVAAIPTCNAMVPRMPPLPVNVYHLFFKCAYVSLTLILEEVVATFYFFLGGSFSGTFFSIYTVRSLGGEFLTNTKDTVKKYPRSNGFCDFFPLHNHKRSLSLFVFFPPSRTTELRRSPHLHLESCCCSLNAGFSP